MHFCCKVGGNGCKPTPKLYVLFSFLFYQVMLAGHALGQAVDAGEGGLGAETFPGAPQLQWWVELLLIHFLYFFLNFEHPERSLEDSSFTVCTHVIKLVVMVASQHLSYMFFFLYFSSNEAYRPCSGLGCGCGKRGLGAETLPRAPSSNGGVKNFGSIIIFSSLILNTLSSPWTVQGS
jgi:hypothetical protein